METKITKHYFLYGTRKYHRGKPENIVMGSFGDKRDPIGKISYLDVAGNIRNKYLEGHVNSSPPIEIDWKQATKAEVEVNGEIPYYGLNGTGTADRERAIAAELKLVKLYIHELPLRNILNKEANVARNFLAEEGKSGRVVSEVFMVVDGQLSEQIETSSSIAIAAGTPGQGLEIKASGGKYGSLTIQYPAGMTFAYLLHKVNDWSKGKKQVEDLKADYHG